MTWPTKNDFADGDVLTAAQVNNIADNLNLADPTGITDGHVLTADGAGGMGWEAVPSGGMTLLQSINLTSGTRQTISSIPGTYQKLFGRVINCTVSGGPAGIGIEVNGNTSNYRLAERYIYGTSIGTNNYSTSLWINSSTFMMYLSRVFTVEASVRHQYEFYIDSYAKTSTDYKPIVAHSTGLQAASTHGVGEAIGYHAGTTGAINSVALYASGATFTGGTFELYGVK